MLGLAIYRHFYPLFIGFLQDKRLYQDASVVAVDYAKVGIV